MARYKEYTYEQGILSSWMIMKAGRENIVFRALSADSMPDFTMIASFIRSMKDEINTIFINVLLAWHEMLHNPARRRLWLNIVRHYHQ